MPKKEDPWVTNPSGVKMQVPAEWLKDESRVRQMIAEGFKLDVATAVSFEQPIVDENLPINPHADAAVSEPIQEAKSNASKNAPDKKGKK
ncbi:hypothetical protein D6827_03530 [Candidatus Parcubacteria bacterium]|nr:MAG: hypothetical protein D6827_03530 [Candidatus Parcubacteria bacterium]